MLPLPPTIHLLPQSASSFSSSTSAITFRVKLADSSEVVGINKSEDIASNQFQVGNTCLLPLPLLVLPRNLSSPQINAKIGQDIIIGCRYLRFSIQFSIGSIWSQLKQCQKDQLEYTSEERWRSLVGSTPQTVANIRRLL